MNETEIEQSSTPDPDLIRIKLLQVAREYLPTVPTLVQAAQQKASPMVKMGITAFRPFLPQLETALLSLIENAPDEKILELVKFIEGVAVWLKQEDPLLSNPTNEQSS